MEDMVMNGKTLVMRFNDLGVVDAIASHSKIIKEKGHVWAGWWAKPEERLPIDAVIKLNEIASQSPITVLLLNSEKRAIYPTLVNQLAFSENEGERVPSPNKEDTPTYYASDKFMLWFRIIDIASPSCHPSVISQYAYEDFNQFKTVDDSIYQFYDNTIVESIDKLVSQRRTLILLRDRQASDKAINATDEVRRVPKQNFTDRYSVTNSNSILLLSDLHFSDQKGNFNFQECGIGQSYSKKKLSQAIAELTKQQQFSSIFCAGDFTCCSTLGEFQKSEEYLFSLMNNHKIDKEDIIIVPGNHDIKFSDKDEGEIVYAEDYSKREYVKLYKRIYGIMPNRFLAVGRKFLLENRLPIEVVGLNSNCLQQAQGHFTGMGFVGNEQLALVEREMGWDNNPKSSYAYRILVLHHHLYPVELIEEPLKNHMYSICLDAGLITSFAVRNKIDLIIHGHKHKRHFIQVGGINEKNLSSFALLGLGSASSTDLAMDEQNSIGILDFNELGKVKIKIMTISNLDNQNKNITFECTLPVTSN